jgi:ferredoxin
MIVTCEKLKFVEGKVVDCTQDFEVDDFVVFTCPALYHRVKHKVEDFVVLDLRVLKAFENPRKVAKSLIASECVRSDLEVEAVETGRDVVYVGENLDLISDLALHCNLTVVTQDEDLIRNLYPYEIRVIKGFVKDVRGPIGDFEVVVDGVDLTNGKSVDVLRAGQVIVSKGFEGREVEGLYTDEYRGAFKVLANLDGYLKVKTLEIRWDVCGFMKSGLKGCDLCLSCPSNAISVDDLNRIIVDTTRCEGCGFCSSICFTSAIENRLLPEDVLIKKIDAIDNECDVLAFVCRRALSDLVDFKDLPSIAPILVPCINSVSEVHYLYAVLKGFRVLAIPCKCEKLRLDCFNIAKTTLNAFDFNCLEVCDWSNLKDVVKSLKREKVPKVSKIELKGENKRLRWLSLVECLMEHELKQSVFENKHFGKIVINDNCTLCNTCKNFCPTNAIRKDFEKILFTHALCIACGLCVKACPENAISLERVLDFGNLQEIVVFEDEMIRCPRCGKPHISKKAYERLKAITGMERSLLFCKECRPIVLLEGVYEDVVKDLRGMRDV